MAVKTLAGSYTNSIRLSRYTGYIDFTVTGTVAVPANTGVYGNASNFWTITNAGAITGLNGIVSRAGGSIGNSGAVSGTSSGIFVSNVAALVSNAGVILQTSAAGFSAVNLQAGGTVANLGTIGDSSTNAAAVFLGAPGSVVNGQPGSTAGLVTAYLNGVVSGTSAGSVAVANYGTIAASGTSSTGIFLQSGGSVSNRGLIDAGFNGVWINGGIGNVVNSGVVTSATGSGVGIVAGGILYNSGAIVAAGSNTSGVFLKAGGTVVNSGAIVATGSNASGVFLQAGGTVVNSGTIATNGIRAVSLSSSSQLVLYPQAVFKGYVIGGGGTSMLELAAGSSPGTLTGFSGGTSRLGEDLSGFSALAIEPSAVWRVAEAGPHALALTNAGTIVVPNVGLLALASDAPGASPGTVALSSRSTLEEEGAVAAGQTVAFLDSGGTLILDDAGQFGGTITGFRPGDRIDIAGTPTTALVYSGSATGGMLSIMNDNTVVASLALSGSSGFSPTAFSLTQHGGGISEITLGTGGGPAGLAFNPVYDASVAQAPPGFLAVLNQGLEFLGQTYNSPVTINLQVGWNEIEGNPLVGTADEGGPEGGSLYSYSQVRAALTSNIDTLADALAITALPTQDPTNGGSFYIGNSQAKALGLRASNASGFDGGVGFQGDVTTARFLGAVLHEVTHAMGRTANAAGGSRNYSILDLFRYTAPGVWNPTAQVGAYYSLDNGNTPIYYFETDTTNVIYLYDPGDWNPPDPVPGVAGPMSRADITEMDVLGYHVSPSAILPVQSPAVLNDFGWAQGWGSPNNPRMVADVDQNGSADYIGFGFQSVFVAYGGTVAGVARLTGPGFSGAVAAVRDFGTNEGYTAQAERGAAATGVGPGESFYGQGFAGVYWYAATGASPQVDAAGHTYNVLTYQTSPNLYGNFGSQQGWTPDNGFQILKASSGDNFASILGFGNAGIVVGPQAFAPGATAAGSYLIPLASGNNSGWKQSVDIRSFTDAAGKVIDLNGDGIADFVGMGPQGLVFALGNHGGPGGGFGLGPLQTAHVGAGGTADLGEAQGWNNAATLRYIVKDPATGFDDILAFGAPGVFVTMGQDPATHGGEPFGQLYLAMADFGSNQGWSVDQTPRIVGDVNGDGIPDIVGFGFNSTFAAIGSRDAAGNLHFALDPSQTIGDFGIAEGWSGSSPQTIRALADVAGTGHSDLILSGAFNTQVWQFG